MELSEGAIMSPQLPADAGVSQSVGETSTNQLKSQSHCSVTQDQTQPGLETDSYQLGHHGGQCLQLAFQDSNLSPALPLLPVNSRPENSATEFSLLQETDTDFVRLRPYQDVSIESERFHTTQASVQSLSQHPLDQMTVLSEESASSCSLSQHSLSPRDEGRWDKKNNSPAVSSKDYTGRSKVNPKTRRDTQLEATKDETFFLSKDISARCLPETQQKDVGVPSSTSSAVSCASKMSGRNTASFLDESNGLKSEGPSGERSLLVQRTQRPDRLSNTGQSRSLSCEVSNITIGSRLTQPDEHSEALHRELLSEVEQCRSWEAKSNNAKQRFSEPPFQSVTPNLNEDKTTGDQTNVSGVPSPGPMKAGVERLQREHALWASGDQIGIDGSYLGFLPHSQSTPGILKFPLKSTVKANIGTLSAIESSKDNLCPSSRGTSQTPVDPSLESLHIDSSNHLQKNASSSEVHSLPSLNYMQKVDAWRANQSSATTSPFDSLALRVSSCNSPKKKASNANDSLNHIRGEQAKSLQHPASSAATQGVSRSSHASTPGSSSPKRSKAVGTVASQKDTTSVSAAPPSSSPFDMPQSHSSSTTVISANEEQQMSHNVQNTSHQSLSGNVQPSALLSLGHFSDVSLDQDCTLSSFQDSCSSVKKQTSVGDSSLVSLEMDNYDPCWNSKPSTLPMLTKSREVNIDERIPLYLRNLGIDQSPSAILNPFSPRGQIKEAEFSLTDLCTLKASSGTPARSIHTSEGDPKTPSSPQWTRSSSESVLSSDKQRHLSVVHDRTSSSLQPDESFTQTSVSECATTGDKTPRDCTPAADASTPRALSKSVRRTEPEGCSAAPPDKVLQQPPLIKSPPAMSAQQETLPPVDRAEVEETTPSLARSSSSSPVFEGTDQCGFSDGSSESSLAVRVATLLQGESTSMPASSTLSNTEHEVREWMNLKLSAQQCKPLKLDKEDIKWIEQFKRELDLKNPKQSKARTDTKSSSASNVGAQKQSNLLELAAPSDANMQPTQALQGLGTNQTDSTLQPPCSSQPDLEAQVCEIAAREGVILQSRKPQAYTYITIATCRRCPSTSSPSPAAPPRSPAPEPPHLLEPSRVADNITAGRQLDPLLGDKDAIPLTQAETREHSVCEADGGLYTTVSKLSPKHQGGPYNLHAGFEDPPLLSELSCREDVTIRHNRAQTQQQNEGNQFVDPSRKGHVSHVHVTLPLKAPDETSASSDLLNHPPAPPWRPYQDFIPLRQSSPAVSSQDEGVGLNSPTEWSDRREPARQRERGNSSAFFPPANTFTPLLMAHRRTEFSPRHLHPQSPEPFLLPYKPHGSGELFHVLPSEAEHLSAESSDTMESSHLGSDDAVPPSFSSKVLGQQEQRVDRGVNIRHAEGIYSKRHRTPSFKMQESKATDSSETSDQSSRETSKKLSTQLSVAFTRVPSLGSNEILRRDQGSSPILFHGTEESDTSKDMFKPVRGVWSPIRQSKREQEQSTSDSEVLPQSSLDQLWDRFYQQWFVEQPYLSSDIECSLLERLDSLSRLIHCRRSGHIPKAQKEKSRRREDLLLRKRERREDLREARRSAEGELTEATQKFQRGREAEPLNQPNSQEEECLRPRENHSRSSNYSDSCHSSSESMSVSSTDTFSSTSASLSSVDTSRLIRVFGAHKVQQLKNSSNLNKLYRVINKQREEPHARRERPHIRPLNNSRTDGFLTDDSTSSISTSSIPASRISSMMLAGKQAAKLTNRSIQTSDLEIITNGSRWHTRDVGIMFPSPSIRQERGRWRNSPKSHNGQNQRKIRRSPTKAFPEAVSWFIPARSLKSAAKKENQPQEKSSAWKPRAVWFEPNSQARPQRPPLQLKHLQDEQSEEFNFTQQGSEDSDPGVKTLSPSLTQLSLQEALQIRRPDFILRSRQRMKSLALQVEKRKRKAAFNRARDELFTQRHEGGALLGPVSRKDIIRWSKQKYKLLPEIQRKQEEELRKAEYRLYRQNAQLYTKKIMNHVLGRRRTWK